MTLSPRVMTDEFAAGNKKCGVTRRRFLGISLASGAALLAGKTDVILGADATTSSNMATNPTFNLGGDFTVNRLGFGAMRVTGEGIWGWPADRQNALKVLRRAVELGVNLIDTADAYGPDTSELLIAEALYPYPKGLVIATKGGLTRPGLLVNGCQTADLTILNKHSMEVSNGCASTGSIYINCTRWIRKCRLKNPSARSSKCRTQEKFGTLDYRTSTGTKSIAHARSLRS